MSLSNKQKVFIEEYLTCWNSSEAARRAGYTGKSNVVGPRLLANVSIKAEIEARIAELKMSADEALVRMAAIARGDAGDFASVNDSGDVAAHEQSYLIKKFKKRRYDPDRGEPYEDIELELYAADAALRDILKVHGLYNDNQQPQEVVSYTPDEWREERARRKNEVKEAMDDFDE